MKRNFTKILAAFALLVGLTIPMGMWGQTRESETITFADLGLENGVQYTDPFGTNISVTFAGGDNDGKYYTTGSGIRTYGDGTITITANDNTVTAISTTFSGVSYAPASTDVWSCNGTTTNSTSGVNASWSGSATEVVMTRPSGSGHWRMQAITVTYTAGGSTPTTYNVTVNQTTGGTIAANPTQATAGTTITLTATPAEGYNFDSWNITPNTVEINNDQFTMPASDVTVSAQWTENGGGSTSGTATLTQSNLGLTGSYSSNASKTIDGITYVHTDLMKNNTDIQAKASSGTIKNSTPYPSNITSVVITHSGTARATTINGSADGTNWTQVATGSGSITADFTGKGYKYFQITRGSNAAYWTQIEITYSDATNPTISADNVDIAYNAENGSIAYTINNPIDGGVLTATTENDWLTLGEVGTTIPFTCSANEINTARTATVTLTYTYNREAVSKDLTITQAAAPVVYNTIPDLFAAATGTATDVNVTFGSWVVSAVTGSNAYLTDNQGHGLIIYASEHGFQVNDVLTGTVSCKLQLYRGSAELTNLTTSTEGLSIAHNGTVTEANIAMADLSGVNTGALVSYEGLACNVTISGNYTNYDLTDGATTIRAYTTLYDFTSTPDLEDGKTYNIKGIFLQYTTNNNNTKEILPRSAEDIVEVVLPVINASDVTLAYDATSGAIAYTIDHAVTGTTLTANSTADWISGITVGTENVAFTTTVNNGNSDRTATIALTYGTVTKNVTVTQGHNYVPATGNNYELFSGDIVEGDYLIVYDGKAMNNIVDSDRLQYVNVTDNNDVIVSENANAIWHIAPSGEYWTIYSADANAYAASTGVKNKAQMLVDGTDNKALWTVSGTETYEFVNKHNAANSVNSNLRNNGEYGFACYATSTGGALSLYKRNNDYTPAIAIEGYGEGDGGYVLVASPFSTTPVAAGMITDEATDPEEFTFDLYKFDQNANDGLEWRNYRATSFDLVPGEGYLYANKNNVTLSFAGTAYTGNGQVPVIAGYNLVGNPYAVAANLSVPYYRLNASGSEVSASTESSAVNAMEGVFVQATEAGSVTFTTSNSGNGKSNAVVMNLTRNRGTAIDRAIVRFDEGQQLPKFQLFENSTKLYIPQGNEDYAIVRSAAQGEMPVSFRASENGTYTIAVEAENVDMNYLHLIDNMTGADVDLLATPNYTFEARTNDYTSRFRLVFSANGIDEQTAETFAFFNGTSWSVSNTGDATLQVVDITGRIISSETINGNATVNLNQPAGIYMLRLVNGNDVKVQKVVVR